MANIDTPENVEFKEAEPFTTVGVMLSGGKRLYIYKVPLSWNVTKGDRLRVPVRDHDTIGEIMEVHETAQLSNKFITKTALEKIEDSEGR